VKPGRGTTRKAIGDFPRLLLRSSMYLYILCWKDNFSSLFLNRFKIQSCHSDLSDFSLTIGLNALNLMLWLRLARYSFGIISLGS
jgi:hypothetical protein